MSHNNLQLIYHIDTWKFIYKIYKKNGSYLMYFLQMLDPIN